MRRFTLIDALAVLSPGAFARVEVELSATNQAAQRHLESGVSFYRNGDYESARIEFGNRLSKLPDFLVNLCQVADKQNRIQEAVNYCEQYLRIESNAKDNPEVLARLERLHQQLGGVVVPQPTPVAQTSSAPTPIAIASSQPTDANPARSRPPADALALLSGGDVLPFGGADSGAGALLTAKEIEAGPAFDDLAGLQQRGAVLNAVEITIYVAGGVAAAAGAGWFGYCGSADWRTGHRRRSHSSSHLRSPTALITIPIRSAQRRVVSCIIRFSSQTYQYRPEAAERSLISDAMNTAAVVVTVAPARTLRRY